MLYQDFLLCIFRVFISEPEKNSKTINRATDDQPLSEDDYNELTTEPNWNPEVVDCVYTIVCDPNTKKGAICNADDGKRWDVNGCPNSDINLMQGCEMKKGDSLDISNLMHRESNLFFYQTIICDNLDVFCT